MAEALQGSDEPVKVVQEGPSGQPGPIEVRNLIPVPPQKVPEVIGPFRLRSFGSVDGAPDPAESGGSQLASAQTTPTEEVDIIKNAAIFAEPTYLPPGYVFESAVGVLQGDEIVSYELTYRGPRGFEITTGRTVFVPPHDIYEPLPAPQGTNDLTIGSLNGVPAVFEPIRPGKGAGGATITVATGNLLTVVYGTVDDNEWPGFDELVKVAESIGY